MPTGSSLTANILWGKTGGGVSLPLGFIRKMKRMEVVFKRGFMSDVFQ